MIANGNRRQSRPSQAIPRIAIFGQPNTGKSTIFNILTNGRQHTANWAGKTIEPKTGICTNFGESYTIVDLPGTHSLSPHSGGKNITCEYFWNENPNGIILVLDGSQLSRSMYLLTDFMGLNVPIIVVVTMVDVLKSLGREIDFQKLEAILGVPVIPVIATGRCNRGKIIAGLSKLVHEKPILRHGDFAAACKKIAGEDRWNRIRICLEDSQSPDCKGCKDWLAVKLLEGDIHVRQKCPSDITDNADIIRIAGCRYKWIRDCMMAICVRLPRPRLNKFDRLALHPIFGTILAFLFLFLGFAISAFAAGGFQHFLRKLVNFLPKNVCISGIPTLFAEVLNDAILPGLMIAAYLLIFVGALTLAIGIMEEVGYIARIAYLFNWLMGRVGLQGKCIIPFISGFGCTVAGVCGARIIDCPCQRRLTIAACWVVPCSGTWGTVGFVAMLFFGTKAILVILGLFILMIVHIILTTYIFGKNHRSVPSEMLMDLPHYHRPNWKNILKVVFRQMGQLLLKSTPVILMTAVSLWAFLRQFDHSHGDAFAEIFAKFSAIFGLHWKLFTALLLSLINRESALGGIAILFGGASCDLSFAGSMLTQNLQRTTIEMSLLASVSVPSALAFLCAFFLSPPCCAAIAATVQEVRSYAWTLRLFAYYFFNSLLAAAVVFHLTSLFL
ncbi:MAG: ferrous iron transport protein B [Puniceicoccales bacterium]|nr:ferrous iron transport protein B [Puniceicoccales bacterium]